VNSGTSTYRAGPRRDYERSTAAHNTVEIDGENQTEVWGAFRAARRATPRLERAEDDDTTGGAVTVTASHDGYERLPGKPRHRRTWRVTDDTIEITDDIDGTGTHRSVTRLIFAPGTTVDVLAEGCFEVNNAEVTHVGGDAQLEVAEVAEAFGQTHHTKVLTCTASGSLPHHLVSRIELTHKPHLGD
jgi:hypothetical protein